MSECMNMRERMYCMYCTHLLIRPVYCNHVLYVMHTSTVCLGTNPANHGSDHTRWNSWLVAGFHAANHHSGEAYRHSHSVLCSHHSPYQRSRSFQAMLESAIPQSCCTFRHMRDSLMPVRCLHAGTHSTSRQLPPGTCFLVFNEHCEAPCQTPKPRLFVALGSAPSHSNVWTTSETPVLDASSKAVFPIPVLASKLARCCTSCVTKCARRYRTSLPSDAKCKHVLPSAFSPVMRLFITLGGVTVTSQSAAFAAREEYEQQFRA